jgi:hypothetical protein
MLPAYRANTFDFIGQFVISAPFRALQKLGKDASIVIDDAIGKQSGALCPNLLFMYRNFKK